MKKVVTLIVTAVMTVGILAGCGASGKFKDGTYTGEGTGMSKQKQVKVEVKVESGKISDIKVVEQEETPTLFDGVEKNLIPEIIKKQGTEDIEAVSGATLSSNGVIEAVNNALKGAQ